MGTGLLPNPILEDSLEVNHKLEVHRQYTNLLKNLDFLTTVSMKQHLSDTKIGLSMRPTGLGKDEWVEKEDKKASSPGATDKKESKKETKKEKKKEKKAKKDKK